MVTAVEADRAPGGSSWLVGLAAASVRLWLGAVALPTRKDFESV